jgi:glyoxylase-like metal-dependent hydrolase (beta-lactamase superfamily II)
VRTILSGIYVETAYPAVCVGAVASQGQVLLIDAPLRGDDARDWLNELDEFGEPRFLAVLDHHPDRVLASRNLDLPRIAHSATSETVAHWSDTYKGAHQPVGSEVDRIKRVTGLNKLTPDLTFSDTLLIHLGDQHVRFVHQPGPTQGAMWAMLEDRHVVFLGDAVTASEPPFLGYADLDAWLDGLDRLRDKVYKDFKLVSGRDGLIDRDAVNNMARFLRKVPIRLARLDGSANLESRAQSAADDLLSDFKVSTGRRDMCRLRLQAGLIRLHRREHPAED